MKAEPESPQSCTGVGMGAGLLNTWQWEESSSSSPALSSPAAHPQRPSSPTPASPGSKGGIWLQLHFTPSPPLCGGGLWLSRGTYTDTPVLKDIFPCFYIYIYIKKKKKNLQWKKPKSEERNAGGRRQQRWLGCGAEGGVSTHLSTPSTGTEP